MRSPLTLLFLALSLSLAQAAPIRGRVTCEGRGVAGVVVSDGIEVALTDGRGRYRMDSAMENGYVFISIPSGYEVDADGLIPRFFVRLSGARRERADFRLRKVDQSRYTMFVTTDIHLTGDAVDKDLPEFHSSFLPGICEAVREAEGPVYSLCLGDMTTDSKWYSNNFAFKEYLEHMSDFPVPVFHVMGNHDNDRQCEGTFEEWESLAEERYKKEIGPNYYSMNIGSYHYLMLDDIITTGPKKEGNPADGFVGKYGFSYAIDPEQMEWIRKDLSHVPSDMGVVVAMHVPFYLISSLEKDGMRYRYSAAKSFDPAPLMEMLGTFREVHFLAGHHHRTQVIPLSDKMTEHVLCSASAVSWKINDIGAPMVCDDGTPAGCQIFKVDGERMSWQYKSNYKSVGQSQCNVYDLNTVSPQYGGEPGSNALLINVFDWDPSWTVKVYEDGLPLEVEQIWGYDPMYLRIRNETKTLTHRPTAFRETLTLHLFRCVRKSPSSYVKVVLTDGFGNEYTAIPGQMAVTDF